MKKVLFCGYLIVSCLLIIGCSKDNLNIHEAGLPGLATLKIQYNRAVIDASKPEPWEICSHLVSVVYYGDSMAGPGNLIWSPDSTGKMRVLVASWMSQKNLQYWPEGKRFKTSNNQAFMSWVTTAPEMIDFLKKKEFTSTSTLHLRIAQLLGMPPDTKNDYFVEYWVYPENLFRPTPDPEICDCEAGLYFPGSATQKHRSWFLNEMTAKYDTSKTSAFPWTRLGYTYDWADPSNEIGLSEFVVDTSSTVTVKKIYSSWEYYQLSHTMK